MLASGLSLRMRKRTDSFLIQMKLANQTKLMPNNQTHHMQTPEGKQASVEGRRRREAGLPEIDAAVFVVRWAGAKAFGWEIRKFGGIVLARSDERYATAQEAQITGQAAF